MVWICGGWAKNGSGGHWAFHPDAGLLPTTWKVGVALCVTGGVGWGDECFSRSGGGQTADFRASSVRVANERSQKKTSLGKPK